MIKFLGLFVLITTMIIIIVTVKGHSSHKLSLVTVKVRRQNPFFFLPPFVIANNLKLTHGHRNKFRRIVKTLPL